MTLKETLQAKYSQIIQEAGKRNSSADADRIKKIQALCQELLSSEDGETTESRWTGSSYDESVRTRHVRAASCRSERRSRSGARRCGP